MKHIVELNSHDELVDFIRDMSPLLMSQDIPQVTRDVVTENTDTTEKPTVSENTDLPDPPPTGNVNDDGSVSKFPPETDTTDDPPPPPETDTTDDPPPPPETKLLDDKGIEWNEKYHAKNKGKKQNGTWKAAKGMTPEAKLEAAAWNSPVQKPVEPNPEETVVPEGGMNFSDIVAKINVLTDSGKVTPDQMISIYDSLGIKTPADMLANPKLIEPVNTALEAIL